MCQEEEIERNWISSIAPNQSLLTSTSSLSQTSQKMAVFYDPSANSSFYLLAIRVFPKTGWYVTVYMSMEGRSGAHGGTWGLFAEAVVAFIREGLGTWEEASVCSKRPKEGCQGLCLPNVFDFCITRTSNSPSLTHDSI